MFSAMPPVAETIERCTEQLADAIAADHALIYAMDPAERLAMGPRAAVALRLIAILRHAEGVARALLEGCQEAGQDLPVSAEVAILAPIDAMERLIKSAGHVTRPPADVISFPGGHRLLTMTRGDLL